MTSSEKNELEMTMADPLVQEAVARAIRSERQRVIERVREALEGKQMHGSLCPVFYEDATEEKCNCPARDIASRILAVLEEEGK